ncbi:MAG: prephenate dehydratase [Magnetococcales bacterium]|nr:prephenate dehydratase [Magnetococcales bacterium]
MQDEPKSFQPDKPLDEMTLDDLRQGIDSVDNTIHDLIIQRTQYVLQVGKVKEKDSNAIFYRPEREARIHRRLEERHEGPLPVAAIHRIFREIISASLNLEKGLSISFLGPEATYTHQAALKHFGSAFTMSSARTIDEVFHEVEVGRADFGVVPVENSTEGMVHHTLDRFVDSPLGISAEIIQPLEHSLLSLAEQSHRIKTVFAHFRNLRQCRQWVDHHLPQAKLITTSSTREALEFCGKKKRSAAIAGTYMADHYGLNVLAENIQDHSNWENRFLVLGKDTPAPSGKDKTTLLFSFRDQPGFLHRILGIFADGGINLTRIESRPSRKKAWDYLFFVDFEGHLGDEAVAATLERLSQVPGLSTKILGSYPLRAI